MAVAVVLLDPETSGALARRVGALGWRIEQVGAVNEAIDRAADARFLPLSPDTVAALSKLDPARAASTGVICDADTAALTPRLPQLGTVFLDQRSSSPEDRASELAAALEPNLAIPLLAPGTPLERAQLSDSSLRGDLLDRIEQSLATVKIEPRLLSHFLTIADEFITNALYNAPIDNHGNRLYAHRSRIDTITGERPITVCWGCDGKRAMVSVRDEFGSMDPKVALHHVVRALSLMQVGPSSAGGAGLGLATAYRCANQLVFVIHRGEYTECSGVIEVGGDYRLHTAAGKCCQIFFREPAVSRSR